MKRFQNAIRGQNNETLYTHTHTHTHVISEKQNQTGRSMVEMLGVLAVIGVLSVAGIAGFKNAMDKNKANTIINEAQKRATLVVPQIQLMGNENPTITEFINNDLGYGEFDTKVYTKADGLPEGQFGIKVSNVPKSICQNILNTIGDNTVIRRLSTTTAPTTAMTTCGETNTFLMVYNNDMSANAVAGEFGYDDCPESFHQCSTTHSCVASENDCPAICELNQALSTGCVCPDHRDRTDDKCGDCIDIENYSPWTQPVLTSNGTMGGSNAFACNASSTIGGARQAYRAFDNSNGNSEVDCWHSDLVSTGTNVYLTWYSKVPIKINSITIQNRAGTDNGSGSTAIKDFKIQYSDDNSTWVDFASGSNPYSSALETYTFSVNASSAHQYWRINILSGYNWAFYDPDHLTGYLSIGELTINADELVSITDYELNASGYCEIVE